MPIQSKLALGMTLLWIVVIAVLTLTPISAPQPVEHSDKMYHLLAFAGLTLPISFFRPGWLLTAIPAFAVFGGLIEIIQPYVGRECNVYDWVADLIGIALGVACGRTAATLL